MWAQKHNQSIDSTAIKELSCPVQSSEKWKQLESKYLKYIALLKEKAGKSKKRIDNHNMYIQLALCLKYKIQNKMLNVFKNIQLNKQGGFESEKSQPKVKRVEYVKTRSFDCKRFIDGFEVMIKKRLNTVFVLLKQPLQAQTKQPQFTYSSSLSNHKNLKYIAAVKLLQNLQSSILTFSQSSNNNQILELKTSNSKLKQQIIQYQQQTTKLKEQISYINQRMQAELLKKSLALMQSQIDCQQKQQLIKQYEIQLQFRSNNQNRVLLFTLQDFQIERRRLEIINQKLYKQFQNTKQTFLQQIRNQNNIINELKSKVGRSSVTLSENNIELESLRAYRFQNEYEKQCERYKQIAFKTQKVISKKTNNSDITNQILNYIDKLLSKQQYNKQIYLKLNQRQLSKLQSIQQKIQSMITFKGVNKIIRLSSLQKSIQQNVKASDQDLNSFLDVFQQQNLSIDSKIQQQLQNKILCLNQRLFYIRQVISTLLQSIQIRNPPKDLVNLIDIIYDIFEFSDQEKQLFYGGKKSVLQRLFSY